VGEHVHAFTPEEIVPLDLATRLCRESHDIPAELIERLHRYWSDAEIAEILMIAGQASMNNRVGSAAREIFSARRSSRPPPVVASQRRAPVAVSLSEI
jgi:alkylhydroperoxidase family enzyme